jgi:hypothetical protein
VHARLLVQSRARIKRQYGSATVTKFFVEEKGDPSSRMQMIGYGRTPGDRKTYAIKQYMEARGLTPKPVARGVWGGAPSPEPVYEEREETPRQTALYEMVRQSQALGDSMLSGFSGADRADSELYFLEAQLYRDVSQGMSFEEAFHKADKRWREYAAGQQKKVDEASKIHRGPMAGQSAAHYKWVSPEGFSNKHNHMKFMVGKADEGTPLSAPSLPPGTTGG